MKKTKDELMVRYREIVDSLGALNNKFQAGELTNEEKVERERLNSECDTIERELNLLKQEKQFANLEVNTGKDINKELREFLTKDLQRGKSFVIPMKRESISYNSQGEGHFGGTADYVQGITVVELFPTDRPDGDIMATAGVPMAVGVNGNKIQWAFAGAVEAAFANELAATTERVISLDKQVPIQQRLTVRVRISQQVLFNTEYDLHGYIVKVVSDSIKNKVNWALASTTKATETFFGPFAAATEEGTYGQSGYKPGKQVGTYDTFTKETAAEMIGKIAAHNLPTTNTVFVMGAEDFWKLKVTPYDQGSGIMLIGNDNRLLGIPVIPSNAINRSTEKGAQAGHNIGLGNFAYVPVLQHGELRLSQDDSSATASNTDELYVTLNVYFSMTVLKDGADAFVLYSKSSESSSDI